MCTAQITFKGDIGLDKERHGKTNCKLVISNAGHADFQRQFHQLNQFTYISTNFFSQYRELEAL